MTERDELIKRLRERARIRRQIPTRKSVQEGEPDRIADLLDEAAAALTAQQSGVRERMMKAMSTLIVEMFDERSDIDGGWLQERATELGILRPVEVTKRCNEICDCADFGDFPQTCYRLDDSITAQQSDTHVSVPKWIEEELKDGDRICQELGLERTEGGRLPINKILAKIRPVSHMNKILTKIRETHK